MENAATTTGPATLPLSAASSRRASVSSCSMRSARAASQVAGLVELDTASGPVHQGQADLTLELGQMLRDG